VGVSNRDGHPYVPGDVVTPAGGVGSDGNWHPLGVGGVGIGSGATQDFLSADGIATPSSNVAAILGGTSWAALGAGMAHSLAGVEFSYSQIPAGGRLTILDGALLVFDIDITLAGHDRVIFNPPKVGSANTSMTVTLAAGGTGCVGKINALGHGAVTVTASSNFADPNNSALAIVIF
jgi:hypothetical protein